jgi:hypothetical protein
MHDRRQDNVTATIASKLIRQDLRTVRGVNHKQIRKQVRIRGTACSFLGWIDAYQIAHDLISAKPDLSRRLQTSG